jgi:FkbM family methyltransferase
MDTIPQILKTAARTAVPRPLRNWMRSPRRSMEWISDAVRFSCGSVETMSLGSGRQLLCHPHAYKVATRAQVADPEQRSEFESFLARCHPDMLLFDIGAHFGIFALAAALWGGKSVAIDASAIATKMIARQVKLNRLQDRVRIVQKVVSDHAGSIGMLSSGVFSDGYVKVAADRKKNDLTRTEATTLDELTNEFGAPTHVKIDVEGHERAVLQGGKSTLREHAPVIFLEVHNEMIRAEGGEPGTVLEILYGENYRIFSTAGEELKPASILELGIIRVVATRR